MLKRSLVFLIVFLCALAVRAQICGTTAAWSRVISYNAGEEVQFNNVKYRANWFTRDQQPDENSGPWEVWDNLGNCDGSVDTLSCDGLGVWLATSVYNAGDQVIFDNEIYTANYWTLNQEPDDNSGDPGQPWTFIGACESTTESTCDLSTPSFEFDLTGAPDSLWVSPQVRRDGLCCSIDPSERPPARCVEFFFTLDPSAIGIIFDIQSGAVPPGALFFQINCQGRYQFGELLCLSGSGPFRLTFCKPGNNPNTYGIQSVGPPSVSPPVTVSDGCSADLFADGYDLSTVEWSSVPSNPVWESYMSCTSQCDSVRVTYEPGAPDSVVYQVSGYPIGGCLPDPVVQQTVVYFVNDKSADIQPKDAMVCFGSTTAELTVTPSGGRPPHSYLWSTGETTQSIFVGEGSYSVEVFDNTTCPSASDSVTVGAFLYPIEADAGPDQELCQSTTQIQLAGQVQEALGGRWSGGGGSFSPNDSTLDAIYFPTALEVSTGFSLTLTTTGNRGCPGDQDEVAFTFTANPTIMAPDTAYACVNNPVAEISATFTDATTLLWQAVNGGNFLPNDSALTVFYNPTAAEITAENTIVIVTADGNPSCPPVTDTVQIAFTEPPSVNIGPGGETCENNPQGVSLSAAPVIAGGVQWSGGAGTFTPSDISLTPTYTPTLGEASRDFLILTATTTDNRGCLPVSESVQIDFTPAPTIQVIPDFAVCETATNIPVSATITNATGVIWSGGNGTYSSTNGQNITYTPDAAELTQGFVDLTATTTNDRSCLDATGSVRITFELSPTISLPTPIFVCSNNPLAQIDADITNADSVTWVFGGGGTTTVIDANTVEYDPIPADTAAGTVSVVATALSSTACPDVVFNSSIEYTGSPNVVITTDIEVCENNSEIQLGATTNGAYGVLWIGGEGAFSPDRITADATYSPSSNEIAAGSVNLTVQTTNTGDCLPTTDDATITILPAPTVDAGPDLAICGDQSSIAIGATMTNSTGSQWGSSSGGTFDNASILSTNYNFSVQDRADSIATIRITTSGNAPCLEVSDFVTITLEKVPEVDAGADLSLCPSQDSAIVIGLVTVANSGAWTTTGTGYFSPQNTDLITGYVPSADDRASGSVILTLTSGSYSTCNQYSDQMTVSFNAGPVLNMMPDFSVCRNESNIPILAEGSPGLWSGPGTFENGVSAQSNIYNPTPAEFTGANTTLYFNTTGTVACPSLEDSVIITFTDGPTLTPLTADTICANESAFSVISTQSNAAGVEWSSSGFGSITNAITDNSITYTLSSEEAATTDTLDITFTVRTTGNGSCPETVEQITNVVIPENNVSTTSSATVCFSQGIIPLRANGNEAESYTWQTTGGGTFPSGNSGLDVSYQMVPSDTLLDSIRFVVSNTGNPFCADFRDTSYYTVITGPTVEAGTPQAVCRDVDMISLSGAANQFISSRWTSNGTGSFSQADSLSTDYFRTEADTIAGAVMFYLTVVGEGGCDQLVDSVEVIFEEGVKVDAGNEFDICTDSSFVNLNVNFSNATGVTWTIVEGNGSLDNTTLPNPVYTVDPNDANLDSLVFSVTTTGNDDCFAQTDLVKVALLPEPIISPLDVTICEDATSVLLEAGIVNAGGVVFDVQGGGVVSTVGLAQANYSVVPNDTLQDSLLVILTSTDNGLCKPKQDTSFIYITPKPTVDAGNDTILCVSETSFQLNVDVTVSTGGIWGHDGAGALTDETILNPVYIISDDDKARGSVKFVYISLFNGGCQSYLDEQTITFTEPVSIEPTTTSSCESGVGDLPINPIVNNALTYQWKTLGSGDFVPSDTLQNVSYSPSAADRALDSVIVRLVASSCSVDSLDFTLYFEPGPQIAASGDSIICQGQTGAFEYSSGFAETTGWISLGSGGITPSLNDSSIIYSPSASDLVFSRVQLVAFATKFGCPTVYDTIAFDILREPVVDAGSNLSLCRDIPSIGVNGRLTNTSQGRWSTSGTGTFDQPNNASTIYRFSPADRDSSTITLFFIVDPELCFDEYKDSVIVNFSGAPLVDAGPDQIICTEDLGVVFDGSFSNASGVQWTTLGDGSFDDANSTNPTYIYGSNDEANKVVTAVIETIGATPCSHDRDSVELTLIGSPIVDAGDDKVYCGVLPDVPLTATVEDATEWEWYSSGVGNFLNPLDALNNVYRADQIDTIVKSVEITMFASINGGCFVFDTLNVIFEAPPKILIENTNACEGEEVLLIGKPVDFISTGADYSWFLNDVVLPAAKDSAIIVTSAGRYKVEMNIDECYAEKEALIGFYPSPEEYDPRQLYICEELGEAVVVKGEGIDPTYRYYWPHVDDSVRSVIIDQGGAYLYGIINEYGCASVNVVQVDDICPPRLFPPTIITPNNDGKNDVMTIKGRFVEDYNLTIFNRWGEIIFFTKDMDDYWDGTYRGEPMPEGVYNWIIEYAGDERVSEKEILKGIITVVR